jgi:DNA invertase Pin-like site-specific DNA recombinase
MEAFGYIRVSGIGQVDGDGFERQRVAIAAHAARSGLTISRWFEETGVSGKTEWENRPAWSEMVSGLSDVRTIIIERLDRLARDLMVQEHIIADLKMRRISLISTEEPDLGTDEPSRVLMRQIMGSIAQYDRAMIVRKLAGSRRRIRESRGKCEGRKVYGDRPGEPEVIATMQQLRENGGSFQAIADSLNSSGTLTRYGKHWSPQSVCKILSRAK